MPHTDSIQLLRQLEPAVRPGQARTPTNRGSAAIEHQSFDQLMAQAARGEMESGRTTRLAFEPGEELDEQQIQRLSAAADRAEAAGARRALMMMDGRGFIMDVDQRTLTAELSFDSAINVGVDAAVFVPTGDERASTIVGPPGPNLPPLAVARQIDAAHGTETERSGLENKDNRTASPSV